MGLNDFTKEELKYLFQLAQYQSAENSNEQLITKIESMIDNYCEHDSGTAIGTFCYPLIHCNKCSRNIRDNDGVNK